MNAYQDDETRIDEAHRAVTYLERHNKLHEGMAFRRGSPGFNDVRGSNKITLLAMAALMCVVFALVIGMVQLHRIESGADALAEKRMKERARVKHYYELFGGTKIVDPE